MVFLNKLNTAADIAVAAGKRVAIEALPPGAFFTEEDGVVRVVLNREDDGRVQYALVTALEVFYASGDRMVTPLRLDRLEVSPA